MSWRGVGVPGGADGTRGQGMPLWAKRDTGPLHTYVPGPLPSEPLPNTYDWRTRATVSGVVVAALAVLIVRSATAGKASAIVALVFVWAIYAAWGWWKGSDGLRVDGERADVRAARGTQTFTGAEVVEVAEIYNGRSPDVRLTLADGRRIPVRTSRLQRGHSVLFEWLRRYAPQAVYDARASKLVDTLRSRGLIAPTVDEPASGRIDEANPEAAD